jgi:hypothetical protein
VVSIFWCPFGFLVIAAFPPKTKITAAYFCNDIILKIVEEKPFDLANSPRQLMLHMDNVTPRRAQELITRLKEFRMHSIAYPPYSRDLVPSDFCLLGRLKSALAGQEFESIKGFLLAIREITGLIGRTEIESVFDAWGIGRLHPDER